MTFAPASDAVFFATPATAEEALASLSPEIAGWFHGAFGPPTLAQRAAWPVIQRGNNLLLAAPTGSGKTLAAFAPIISGLVTDGVLRGLTPPGSPQLPPGSPSTACTRQLKCLYVAPLKALSRDAAKNLWRQIKQLREAYPQLPRLRLGLRTGDTPTGRRRKQVLRPPHILLTTPESLAILLSQVTGRAMFRSLRWVVVDEIHAMATNKRGVDLALGLERLEALVAEQGRTLQRIGLSATCSRLEDAGRFLVGMDRPVSLAQVEQPSPLELKIEPLPPEEENGPRRGFVARLLEKLHPILKKNRTTLLFTNIRSTAELICWALRRRYPKHRRLFGVHHSSLAPRRRRRVERLLKEGRLRCVVSSTSLELGVDIGSIDQVVFLNPPGGAVKLLQRVGRSGHRPGQGRRGLLLTGGPAELLESVVTAASSRAGQLEHMLVPRQPLDVLCQHLVGMSVDAWWSPEDALRLIRRADPYRDLDGATLAQCLDYLSGTNKEGQPWLLPRLRWQEGRFTLIDDCTARLLRRNLGTILNMEAKAIRLLTPAGQGTSLKDGKGEAFAVGTLDEGYADQLQPGDRFILDGRCFEFRKHEEDALVVEEVSARPFVPHWASHGWVIAPELAERLYLFRLQTAEALREGEHVARALLQMDYHLSRPACAEVVRLFRRQEEVSEVPDIHTLLIEAVVNEVGVEYFVHTPLNRAGNDALCRVLLYRMRRDFGWRAEAMVADLGIFMSLPFFHEIEATLWRSLLSASEFDEDFHEGLSNSIAFRERFARLATTGLMVLKQPWGRRRKVGGHGWAGRRLFDLVRQADPAFLFLRQAEEEMCTYACDAPTARRFLERLPRMGIHVRGLAAPSPLALSWTQPAEFKGPALTARG